MTQSDVVVGPVREQYEKQKAASIEQQKKPQKAAPAAKPAKPASIASKPAKKSQVASGGQAAKPQPPKPAKSKYCTVYDVVSQSMEPCR